MTRGGERVPVECRRLAMSTWGVIGSGHVGSTVARLAVDAGHGVVMSTSRGHET